VEELMAGLGDRPNPGPVVIDSCLVWQLRQSPLADNIKHQQAAPPGLKILVVFEFMAGRLLPAAARLGAHTAMHKAEAPDRLLIAVCQLLEQ
jgi:hypothetical protein